MRLQYLWANLWHQWTEGKKENVCMFIYKFEFFLFYAFHQYSITYISWYCLCVWPSSSFFKYAISGSKNADVKVSNIMSAMFPIVLITQPIIAYLLWMEMSNVSLLIGSQILYTHCGLDEFFCVYHNLLVKMKILKVTVALLAAENHLPHSGRTSTW